MWWMVYNFNIIRSFMIRHTLY